MRVPSRFLVLLTIVSSLLAIGGLRAEDAAEKPAGSEKRIALVIGNAAYEAGALATPANDAGLIAQTLQAAGFDVVGARDLDEASLRGALRDFTDKAAESGPDTVAFIYLSGYGLQFNGENFFAPIDAKIGSATDVPARALRISDFKRQLAGLPLKARFVVLDAARTAPFAKNGDPLAGGLALSEADPGSLIAYNAAPGTVGPEEKGPYGAYAQALVEMIREGGLPPDQLFDRVRLRVSETTNGAEVPWNATRLETSFVFFQRAADAPPVAPREEVAELDARPIRELGVKAAYSASLKRDTLQGYQDFVEAYPKDAAAKRVRALIAARRESITWRRSAVVDTPDAYWSYLNRYPRGPHAWDARRRLRELSVAMEPPPRFAALAYDVPPPPPEEIVYVERPAVYFGDPVYDFAPPPPPPVVYLPSRPAYIVDLPPPPPVYDDYALPVPAFVPVPVYVRAPVYIAPPPNNAYYEHIHDVRAIDEINARNAAYGRDRRDFDRGNVDRHGDGHDHGPGFGRDRDGPSIGAIGAGAVAGAALGAAAARVALPPALARKAALQGNGPSPLRPGFGDGQPGQGSSPNGAPQANRPGWQGQPGQPGRPAIGGQPLPGQNGQGLPQQANRPGLQVQPNLGGQPGNRLAPNAPATAPNGQTPPLQANQPGQPGNRPAIGGQPLPGQNGQVLPQQANRPGLQVQPNLGGQPGNRLAPNAPATAPNGQTPPLQANQPGQPGNRLPGNPVAAPNGQPLPQQANRPGGQGPSGQPGNRLGAVPFPAGASGQPNLQANRPQNPSAPGRNEPASKLSTQPRLGADPVQRLEARPELAGRPAAGPNLGARGGPGVPPQDTYRANPAANAAPARQPGFELQRQQAIQAQQQQRQQMQQQQSQQAAQQRQMMMQQQQAMQRQQMQQQAAQQQAIQRQQMMQQQAAQQQAMQRQQMMQQQAQQQAMQRQQMMQQQQAAQARQSMAPRPQPSGGGGGFGGCRPGLPCR